MDGMRSSLHPVLIFVFSVIALCMSLFLYIYWYVEVSTGLKAVVKRFNIDTVQVFEYQTWMVIISVSILVGLILMGIFTIFIFNQKTLQLYRLQNNFINNFTHELKTPVTSLKLYLETFSMHELPRDEQIKYLRYMLQDVERLSMNTTRILNLARIEARSYKGEFIEADIAEIIQRYITNNEHLWQNSRVHLENPEGESFYYRVNLPLFEMLLNNLFTNAIKYNRSFEPDICIRFLQKRKKLEIHFTDNGVGIEKKELKRIFRKFYQVGCSYNMTAKGSGLGLYLVMHIARIHGWNIRAASPGKDKGASFILFLPANRT